MRLPDGVRNSPTLTTPEVDDPGETKAEDSAAVVARRACFTAQSTLVRKVRESGTKWAKTLRETVLGGKHVRFSGKNKDLAKLGKLIVLLKTEFSAVGLDLASFDFSDPTKEVIPLVNELVYDTFSENRARRAPFETAARSRPLLAVTFKMLALLRTTVYTNWAAAQQGEVIGTAAAAAIPTSEDSEAKQLLNKQDRDRHEIRVLEHYIKNQKGVALALKAAAAPRGGLNGYQAGMRRKVYQQAVGDGPDAFSEVCEVYGAPTGFHAGVSVERIDLSAHGFAVGGAQKQEEQNGLLDELGVSASG
ncbi:hypothetical protein CYMTET_13035 [Cymbomonas tetramitiformis]|uniref:Uncharacterized protein n=1 Tax=Cymbomonas tetramitiformis TaxID=36881 RepID=A0AAE0LB96_9CHLO|nr:hypothetical protein CYMTET_13035 [Cymbomonas tetramitiformis]